ncbi:MAG: ribosome maturation factor RimM, partial [Actinomycetota bacterium]
HLVSLVGIDDRTVVETMTNAEVWGEPIADPGVVWVHELIGARVVGVDGTTHGTCVAVVDNPAHPILELDSGALVPSVFIVAHDSGVVTIDPPEGLFDLGDD